MNIQRFVLVNILASFLVIAALSWSFYLIERVTTLRYLAIALNQSIFNLEEDLRAALQHKHPDLVQSLLDQSAAIDNAVAVFSLSLDGKTIAASSSRGVSGKPVEEGYRPIAELREGIVEDQYLKYRAELTYFSDANKERAVLLVDLDRSFVFGRLNEIALFYGLVLFLVLTLIALVVYGVIRRWVISPLERITERAHDQTVVPETHWIEEFSLLDRTLCDSFRSMQNQQNQLKEALDETRYLDGILRTVADINQYLLTSKHAQDLLRISCKRLCEHPGYELCHISLKEGSRLVIRAFSDDRTGYLYPGMTIAPDLAEGDPTAVALNENQTVVRKHLERDASLGSWRYIAEAGRFGSVIAIPMIENIEMPPVGVVTIYATNSEGFDPKEIAMLEELAGDIGFAIGSFAQREKLHYTLTTDANTNLPNRFSLVEALVQEGVSALAIINIDRFSDINEVYGNEIGDAILAGYGHWLNEKITSGEGMSLFKLGSDEYALLYRECREIGICTAFLEELIASTQKESFVVEGIEIVLTITVGIAPASDRVLEHATAALKQAKRKRHSLELFSLESKREQENNIAWYKRVKEAIEESRIVPYFQPIVNNQTGAILKYEALVRLIDETGAPVSPFHFLEIAKKTKLYPDLTKIMIDRVTEVFQNSTLPVSLNLSTQDLVDPALADYLESKIRSGGLGKRIIFEILESEGIENYTEVSAFVDRFKAIGCRFAIDDFGSGYSNFEHLLKLNVDTLKIDGGLIRNLPHDRNAQIFVKHIADFAHEMGITTVAEFVASEEIYKQVRELGIDASQGYYFYEPAPTLVKG